MEKTLELLLQEVNSDIQSLKGFEFGKEGYTAGVNDTCKLLDKATALIKLRDEAEAKAADLELKEKIHDADAEERAVIRAEEFEEKERIRLADADLRKQERCEDRTEREQVRQAEAEAESKRAKVNVALDIAKLAVPVLTTSVAILHNEKLSKMLLKFEETGVLSTSWSRSFFNKVLKH